MRKKTLKEIKEVVVGAVGEEKKVGLYDQNGCFIPPENFSYRLVAPRDGHDLRDCGHKSDWMNDVDFSQYCLVERFERIRPFVPADSGIELPTRKEIIRALIRCDAIHSRLRDDEASKNILLGAHLPVILPKCTVNDHGLLFGVFLEIMEESIRKAGARTFINDCKEDGSSGGGFEGRIRILPQSRFQEIRKRMAMEFVSGLTFFLPFQGHPTRKGSQLISLFPEEYALSCFDTVWGWVLYPEMLLGGFYSPVYELAGITLNPGHHSLFGGFLRNDYFFHLVGSDKQDFNPTCCSSGLFLSR
ncbi:MAG TPA: hypothetical protein PLV72_02445 [Candidatus Magasanikbacteria bacterium]|nr:hypothetical protein [Candidatus Magasanikbacteria bacterium]